MSPAKECAFCRVIRGEVLDYVVYEDDSCLGFLDRRPIFPGHTLVVPKRHVETIVDLPSGLFAPLFTAVALLAEAIEVGLGAQGSFVGINNRVSQSVPHLHVHVVPRSKGDGLRGFFWPRHPYPSEEAVLEAQQAVIDAVARIRAKR